MAVYTVQFTPSEDDLAIGKSLAPLHSQALSVEGVPTIIDGNDFNLPKMMGIMRLARRRARQVFCVNGSFFSLRRRLSGRWKSGNPGFGFPLFHRPKVFLVFGVYS